MEMDDDQKVLAARAKLAERFGDAVRLGGKGTMKRKKKVAHKTTTADDKKVQSALKKAGAQPLPSIEEVNMFRDDNSVMHFTNPKVQGSIRDNVFMVQGTSEVKSLRDLMPGILSQLGPKHMELLKEFAEQMKEAKEEIPDLEAANFEDVAAKD
jgi:nascent polypeptide-associated complex subunit beta